MASNGEQCEQLARNLIDTLGPERAVHVAHQFGWYGVVEEISRQKTQNKNPGVHEAGTA